MKLACFPYLIQKEIYAHLSISNIFFLSLCSKKTKNSIKEIQKKEFEKVKRIEYIIYGDATGILSEMGPRKPSVLSLVTSQTRLPMWMASVPVEELKMDELGIPIIIYRSPVIASVLIAKHSSNKMESVITAIHNHLYDLLGHHTKFWLTSGDRNFNYLPMLQNIEKLKICGDKIERRVLDKFLSNSTSLECFEFEYRCEQQIELRAASKIYDLDTVYARTYPLTTNILKYFNGRHAFLGGRRITMPDVIPFLKAWQSGEKFQKLEVISLSSVFNVWEVRNRIEFKEVNTDVTYFFDRKFAMDPSPVIEPSEFKSRFYIVRKTDGHVASVKMTGIEIFMGVWNKTESQFLEKYQ